MPYRKIKVLIVDDSLFFRNALKQALGSDPHLEIVGTANDCFEAEKKIKELSPDVMTLDVEMPGMKGTDFIKKIMPVTPVPVVLVSSLNMSVFEALQSGAIDFVKKPDISKTNDFASFASELTVKVKIASTAKVGKIKPILQAVANVALVNHNLNRTIVAIGASTGGTEATLEILKRFPADFPPVLITQHMPVGFTKMYADRLNKICNMRVEEAENGMRVEQGLAIIAAGDKQMTLAKDARGYFIKSVTGDKVSGHCPSVDVLFNSVAKVALSKSIGIILTGMGRDGADGLLAMRRTGAFTVGQDKDSCVVYGMPMVAEQIGAVAQQTTLTNIANVVTTKLNSMR